MAYYVITYDLIARKDYKKLTDELVRLKAEPVALSVWLLERYDTDAFGLRDYLNKGFLDNDDRLVVIEFEKGPAWVRALEAGARWIAARFP